MNVNAVYHGGDLEEVPLADVHVDLLALLLLDVFDDEHKIFY